MAKWDVLPLTLMGRIETIRMNVLPRLLFLFQSLPVIIPSSTFKRLDKIISKFLWQNKRARINYKILLCPKERGGLNLPNLKKYYWAAQLKALIMWITKETDALLVGMEQRSCQHILLESLPFLTDMTWKKLKIGNDWIKVRMKMWSSVRKELKLSSSISRATKIARNPEFLPSMMEGEETKKGIISKMYKALQHESNDNYMDIKAKWELEANIIMTDEKWEETFKAGHKLISRPSWREFEWKVKMHFF